MHHNNSSNSLIDDLSTDVRTNLELNYKSVSTTYYNKYY